MHYFSDGHSLSSLCTILKWMAITNRNLESSRFCQISLLTIFHENSLVLCGSLFAGGGQFWWIFWDLKQHLDDSTSRWCRSIRPLERKMANLEDLPISTWLKWKPHSYSPKIDIARKAQSKNEKFTHLMTISSTTPQCEKWGIYAHQKIFRQINYLVLSFVKTLLSRNFCQNDDFSISRNIGNVTIS